MDCYLSFEDFDKYLLAQKSKIVHQVWFGIIPNKKKARKVFKSLKKCRDSWIIKNPLWSYVCWNLNKCYKLIQNHYPHHLEMYENYKYHIQRCDVIRYFILHRYGGLYADMDYFCNRSWEEVTSKYSNNIYLVETPNNLYKLRDNIHISNSLMFCSKPGHIFWNKVFIELEINKISPIYYSRHMCIMFSSGPGILNRIFNKYKLNFQVEFYPFKLFHPHGILNKSVIQLNNLDPKIYAVHLGKGSWEKKDSLILLCLYKEILIILFILFILIIPNLIYGIVKRVSK